MVNVYWAAGDPPLSGSGSKVPTITPSSWVNEVYNYHAPQNGDTLCTKMMVNYVFTIATGQQSPTELIFADLLAELPSGIIDGVVIVVTQFA